MAYLMMKYQDPTTYALMDLSGEEFALIDQGLRELEGLYEGLGAGPEQMRAIEALSAILERRYDSE